MTLARRFLGRGVTRPTKGKEGWSAFLPLPEGRAFRRTTLVKHTAVRGVSRSGHTTRWVKVESVSVFVALLLANALLPGPEVEGATLDDRLQAVGPGVHLRTIVWQDEGKPADIHRIQLLTIDRSYLAPLGPLVISSKVPATPSAPPASVMGTNSQPAGSESGIPGLTPGVRSSSPTGSAASPTATPGVTSKTASTVTTSTATAGGTTAPGSTGLGTVEPATPAVTPVLVAGLQEEVPEALANYPGLAGIRIRDGELIHASSGVPAVGILLNGQPVSGLPLLWAKAEPLRPGGVPYFSVSIDRVNLPHGNGITYYTSRFGKATGTESGTTEFVLAGKDGQPLTRPGPDTEFEAVVVSVRRSGNSNIPQDGAVLAVSGPEATRLAGYLTNGQSVRLTFQLIPEQWRSAREVMPGEHVLLAGRVVRQLPADAPGVNTPSARVALAYNDRTVMVVTVDDTASISGPEWAGAPGGLWRTGGLTLSQFARLLQDLGMFDAVSLPNRFVLQGTAMPASTPASPVASTPSWAVGVWNTAPAGPLFLLEVEGNAERVLVGSRFALQAKGLDTGFHPLPLSPASLGWNLLTNNVVLTNQGTTAYLTAQSPGRVTVRAEVLTPEGTWIQKNWEGEVIAADRLRRITISPSTALIPPGQSLVFTVTGWDEAGRPVYVDPSLLVWDIPASVGRFDSATGTLLPAGSLSPSTSSSGVGSDQGKVGAYPSGIVRASLRTRPDLSATVAVTVSPDLRIMSDMAAQPLQWTVAELQTAYVRLATAPSPRPRTVGSLVLQPALKSGSAASELLLRPQPEIAAALSLAKETRFVGLWVYVPQEQGVTLTAEWVDATGRAASSSFTPWGTPESSGLVALLGFTPQTRLKRGWHFLLAPLPAAAAGPVTLSGIRIKLDQQDPAVQAGGLPAFGDLLALPATPPIPATSSAPAASGSVTSSSSMMGNPAVATSPVSPGTATPASATAVTPASPATVAATGVTATAATSAVALPVGFGEVQPADGRSTPTPTPRLAVRLKPAPGWEVDTASLRLWLDGKGVWNRELASSDWGRLVYGEGGFDRASGVFWFMPAQPLLPGRHEARLELTLVSGNQGGQSTTQSTAELRWQFTVAPISVPAVSRTRPLRIAVVGGPALSGVSDEAGERIFREIIRRLHDKVAQQEAPDLVVFLGDMVAANNETLYDRASQLLQTLGIPYLVVPGKRDLTGDTSRDRFLKTWGHAPLRLDIGRTRLILLDTVQGIGGYDPTQWDWFTRQLAETPGNKIDRYVIFGYRSPLAPRPADGSDGWPSSEEAQKVTSLLAAVRQAASSTAPASASATAAATPDSSTAPEILFVSGSPAAFLAQQDNGILYLTSGGGGRQLEAEPETGGFYHWLELTLPAEGPAHWSVIPLVQSVTLAGLPEKLPQGASSTPWAVADLYTASRSPLRVAVQPPLTYKWSVSDPRLATIDPQTGKLTGKAPGKVQVTLEVGGVSTSRQVEIISQTPVISPSTSN